MSEFPGITSPAAGVNIRPKITSNDPVSVESAIRDEAEVLEEMGFNPLHIIAGTVTHEGFGTSENGRLGRYNWTKLTFDEFKERLSKKRSERLNSDPVNDPVSHPSHYTSGKIEVIDFIEDQQLGFHEGNVVKYVARAGKKDPTKLIQDLEKARWYLDRRIEKLKEAAE